MQRILFPVLFLLSGNFLMAQTFRADSLLNELKRHPENHYAIAQNLQKAYREMPGQVLAEHVKKTKQVIIDYLDPNTQIDALRSLGSLCWEKNLPGEAIQLYDESIAIALPIEAYEEIARSHYQLAMRLRSKRMFSQALTRAYKANEYFVLAGHTAQQAIIRSLMASIAYNAHNFSLALEEGEKALSIFRKLNPVVLDRSDSIEFMSTLNTCALAHLELSNIDHAMAYFAEAEKFSVALHHQFWTSLINGNKAAVYAARGDLDLAVNGLLNDYNNSLKFKEWESAASSAISLAGLFIRKNDWRKAKEFLLEGDELINKYGANRSLRGKYLRTAAQIWEHERKHDRALDALEQHNTIRDSMDEEREKSDLSRIKTEYDIQQKESQIELLVAENRLRDQQITIRNTIVIASAVTIVLLFFLAFVIYRHYKVKRRDNLLLVERNNEIGMINEELRSYAETLASQNMTIQKLNEDLEMRVKSRTHELQEANTELDMFLYRASHDIRRPITTLLGLSNLANVTLHDANAVQLFSKVTDTATHMDRMLHKLQMVYSLNRPLGTGTQIGITQAIQNTLDKFAGEMKSIGMRYKMNVSEPIAYQGDESLFSIIFQNLVENAITFRKPEELEKPFLWVDIAQFNQDLMVRVRDNGIGIESDYIEKIFDLHFRGTALSRGNGLGLYLVKKALALLKGRVEVVSEYGVGSNFIFFFPTHS